MPNTIKLDTWIDYKSLMVSLEEVLDNQIENCRYEEDCDDPYENNNVADCNSALKQLVGLEVIPFKPITLTKNMFSNFEWDFVEMAIEYNELYGSEEDA
tara:strand:+ start:337 stop:633 length:297 start_codon:yes stop_codon:yes gene_type:complete